MRYKLILDYDGADFCGWQSQPSSPSVQETLEHALSTLLGSSVSVVGAGRTDTGVSALGYVAHFDCPEADGVSGAGFPGIGRGRSVVGFDSGPDRSAGGSVFCLDTAQLRYKLNAILPDSVAIRSVEPAADDFHARFDATKRTYRYFLHRVKDPFLARTSYWYGYPDVDFDLMNRAAATLVGRHDFSCFEKTGSDNKTSICTVFSAAWHPYQPQLRPLCQSSHITGSAPFAPSEPGGGNHFAVKNGAKYWYFEISADRFLRNMVRAVTGTLLEVGRGKRSLEDFATLVLPAEDAVEDALNCRSSGRCAAFATQSQAVSFTQRDLKDESSHSVSRRSLAGESVPGHALFLVGVEY